MLLSTVGGLTVQNCCHSSCHHYCILGSRTVKGQKSVAPSWKAFGTFWLYLIDQNFVTLLYLSAKQPGEYIIFFPSETDFSATTFSHSSHTCLSLGPLLLTLLAGVFFSFALYIFLYSFLYSYFWLAHSFRFLSFFMVMKLLTTPVFRVLSASLPTANCFIFAVLFHSYFGE